MSRSSSKTVDSDGARPVKIGGNELVVDVRGDADGEMTDFEQVEADVETLSADAAARFSGVAELLAEIGDSDKGVEIFDRLDTLERDMAASRRAIEEHHVAREAEIKLLRTRLDEALDVVNSGLSEQQDQLTSGLQSFESELREQDLTSRDKAAQHERTIEERATALTEDIDARTESLEASMAKQREALERTVQEQHDHAVSTIDALDAQTTERFAETDARLDALAKADGELAADVDKLRTMAAGERDALKESLRKLRTDLDELAGESKTELDLAMAQVRDDRASDAEQASADLDELRAEWIEGLRDVLDRMDAGDTELRRKLTAAQREHEMHAEGAGRRLEEVRTDADTRLHALHAELEKQSKRTESVAAREDELDERLESLSKTVTGALTHMATEVTARVQGVQQDLDGVRDGMKRNGSELKAISTLSEHSSEAAQRLAALDRQVEVLTKTTGQQAEALAASRASLADAQRQSAALGSKLDAVLEEVVALRATTVDESAINAQLREQSRASAAVSARLSEVERIARTAAGALQTLARRTTGVADAAPIETPAPAPYVAPSPAAVQPKPAVEPPAATPVAQPAAAPSKPRRRRSR